MGILARLRLVNDLPSSDPKILAQYGPPVMDAPYGVNYWNNNLGAGDTVIDLISAM